MHAQNIPELLHLFLKHTPVAVAMFNREMQYIATSCKWLTDWDVSQPSLIGYCHCQVLPNIVPCWKEVHERCLGGILEKCDAYKIVKLDGSVEWLKWECHPWYEKSGEIGGTIFFTEAITEHKRTEAALEQSKARFQKLAANVPGMIYQLLLRPDGSVSLPYVSPSCRQLFEFEVREIEPNPLILYEQVHPEDYAEFNESMAISAETLLPWLWEGRIITVTGKLKWVRAIARPQKQPDNAILWDGLIIDISDRVQAELQLRQYQGLLEELVTKRTSELNAVNMQLQAEIVERQGVEAALRQSEKRFQRLASNIPGVIYQYVLCPDGSYHFPFLNKWCRQIYEFEPQQVKQNPQLLFDVVYPEDLPLVQESMMHSAATLEPWVCEWRIITPSGQKKWLRGSARPEKQANGDMVWDGLIIDVTEQKAPEEALRQSENKFRTIFEKSADGILIYNGEVFIDCNLSAAKMMGCSSKDQLMSLSPSQISPEYQPGGLTSIEKAIQLTTIAFAEGSIRFEWIIERIDGKQVPLEVVLTAIPLNGEEVFYTIWRDISDRKQAEEALRESEFRYRELARREQLVNNLANQIRNTLDLNTILETAIRNIQQILRIDRCSFSWFKPDVEPASWETLKEAKHPNLPSLLGCHPADKIGPVTEMFLNQEILKIDDVREFHEPMHREFLESVGIKSEIVLPIKTRSGQIGVIVCGHWSETRPWTDSEVELLQAVIDQLAIAINQAELYTQSQEVAIAATKQTQQLQQTLGELKQTQSQLVQSEKMSSLGQLVAGVAHEINNPVNFIYGNLAHASKYAEDLLNLLRLYQEEYPQPTDEIQAEIKEVDLDFLIEDLPKIMTSMKVGSERIREIVQSLRTFSRLDEAEMKTVDIHEGIESTLMILQHRLKSKHDHTTIEIIQNYANLPKVVCYAGQLNQVFMNLLANAMDALEEGLKNGLVLTPTINITTEILGNNWITIRIADNGVGMDASTQQRLFDPFFTTKPVGVGTGLGLSISYQIVVDRHGGKLYCTSEVGKGTEFVIEIPIFQAGDT